MSGNPIRKVALRNLAAHKVRLALTVLSVVLGTAFITGSFVFTDTLQRTFDGIFGDALDASVRRFQREHDLDPDGVVGPLSWRKILSLED